MNKLEKLLTPGFYGKIDQKISQKGKIIIVLCDGSAKMIEKLIRQVATIANAPTDWGYYGGRAVVKTLGKPHLVRKVLLECLQEKIFEDEEAKYSNYLKYYIPENNEISVNVIIENR